MAPSSESKRRGRSQKTRFCRKFGKLMFSRSCEYALIRWMLLCVGLGSFLLLYNEIEPSRSQLIVQEPNDQNEIRMKLEVYRRDEAKAIKELQNIKSRLSQHNYAADEVKLAKYYNQSEKCLKDVESLDKRLKSAQGANELITKKKLEMRQGDCANIGKNIDAIKVLLATKDKLMNRQAEQEDKLAIVKKKIKHYEGHLNNLHEMTWQDICKTKEACPPYVWSQWSTCTRNCEGGRRFRKANYAFICITDEVCKQVPNEYEDCNTHACGSNMSDPAENDPINPLNPPILLGEGEERCGLWQDEYIKLHKDMLSGRTETRYLVYSTGKGFYPIPGGFASRIKGITTVFFLALLTKRAFLIEWMDQEGFTEMLEPKYIDWSQSDFLHRRYYKRPPIRDIGSWRSFHVLNRTEKWYKETNFSEFFNLSVELVPGHGYDFTYAVLQNKYFAHDIYKYGLNAIKCRICCVWDFLFQQSYAFNKDMNGILNELKYPDNALVVMHIKVPFDKKIADVLEYSVGHLLCSNKVTRENHISNYTKTVTTNQRLLRHMIGLQHKDVIVPTYTKAATQTVHYHIGHLSPTMDPAILKGVLRNTIIDFFLLLNSTIIIREKGHQHWFASTAEAIRHHYHPDRITYMVNTESETPHCNKRTPIIAPIY